MKLLSSLEELLIMAILTLKTDAYGVTIKQKVTKLTGKDWSIGAIYDSLYRLEEKKYIRSMSSEPIAERGGRSKKLYEITGEGIEALNAHKKVREEFEKELDGLSLGSIK